MLTDHHFQALSEFEHVLQKQIQKDSEMNTSENLNT